ncbi:MAG: MBL fold metallo-hydrolase [Archaeoglobaceae archaeon]|nr:MBL fold metallo-hydrolase [Archaeoglobaceae archaeon]MDW8117367.1 MBL fold metallo-hydrolase [Archaeoglobaceae archaeon]
MNIIEAADNLYLVDLPQNLEGFRKFISCWVIKNGSTAALVDVGPKVTIPKLLEALNYLGIKKVEYILLTHIHLDHSGGIAEILEKFPEAKVVAHKSAKKHLINPEKLWKASLDTIGNIAEVYGEPKGISELNIYDGKIEFAGKKIEIIETPGHASHHQSYLFGEFLFIGESAGVHVPLKNDYYLRPATPPKFYYEPAMNTLENLLKFGSKRVCFAHFGFKRDSIEIIERAMKQLRLWVSTVYDLACRRDIRDEKELNRIAKEELLEKDIKFSNYKLLDDDIKKREDFFIANSLKGIQEYVYETYCL